MKSHANDSNTTRIAILETTVSHINETLIRLETAMTKGFGESRAETGSIRREMAIQFRWVMGTLVLGYIFPIISRLLHWI